MTQAFPKARKASRHLSDTDPRLKLVIDQVGPVGIRLDLNETVFASLARSIVYQQLHGKAAASIVEKFKALYGEDGLFPEPQQVVATEMTLLRSAGLSGAKAAAIKDLAKKTDLGLIPDRAAAETMTDAELIEAITQVKGIGRWTVEMFLIFTLGRTDVFPVHDYGVRKGFAAVYRKRALPTPKAFEKIGERWKPFRSAAAWYFWRALELPAFQAQTKKKKKNPRVKKKTRD